MPNVVIIFTDDQGYGDLSCYGHPTIHTPHLDRMAAEGMKLTQFYVPSPVCSPSRAGLLTGCYPKRVGMHKHVIFPEYDYGLHTDEFTIADMLAEWEPDQHLLTKRFTEEAERFIQDNKARPFFLYLAHPMPHIPVYASEAFEGTSLLAVRTRAQGSAPASRDTFLYTSNGELAGIRRGAMGLLHMADFLDCVRTLRSSR